MTLKKSKQKRARTPLLWAAARPEGAENESAYPKHKRKCREKKKKSKLDTKKQNDGRPSLTPCFQMLPFVVSALHTLSFLPALLS